MVRQPSSVVEGFNCPDCKINLGNSSLLQDHWIRFHSSFEVQCRNRKLDRSIHERATFVQFPGARCFSRTEIPDELNKQVHNNRSCTGDRYQVRIMLTIGLLILDIISYSNQSYWILLQMYIHMKERALDVTTGNCVTACFHIIQTKGPFILSISSFITFTFFMFRNALTF